MAIGGEVLFISTDYIKRYTNLSGSLLEEYFKPILLVVQDSKIQSYLGTDLYNKIASDISGSSLTGNYQTLHEEYVMKALLWWFMHDFYVHSRFKVDNGGIVLRTSEDTTDPGDVYALKDQYKNNALFYSQRLQDYLCENSSLFPEYTSNSGADMSPKGIKFLDVSNGAQRY